MWQLCYSRLSIILLTITDNYCLIKKEPAKTKVHCHCHKILTSFVNNISAIFLLFLYFSSNFVIFSHFAIYIIIQYGRNTSNCLSYSPVSAIFILFIIFGFCSAVHVKVFSSLFYCCCTSDRCYVLSLLTIILPSQNHTSFQVVYHHLKFKIKF